MVFVSFTSAYCDSAKTLMRLSSIYQQTIPIRELSKRINEIVGYCILEDPMKLFIKYFTLVVGIKNFSIS